MKNESARRPLVSVITYVHNVAEYLDELIASVLSQTYTHFEYLILDDGSTDQTRDVIHPYLSDKRLRYVYQEAMGQGGRFIHLVINKCLSLTQGELVCMIGGDDVFMPNRIERHVVEFLNDPDLDVAFSEGELIDAQGKTYGRGKFGVADYPFHRGNLARRLLRFNFIPHPTTMMRRRCFDRVGLFEEGFAADYHFWLKSATRLKFKFVDEKLVKYRIHEKGSSTHPASRAFVREESLRLVKAARQRYTLSELYPELDYCRDKEKARASAYLDLGVGWIQANFPAPELAIEEFKQALAHDPDQVEAAHNLGVCLIWLGNYAEGTAWLQRALGCGGAIAQNNFHLAGEIINHRARPEALTLMIQDPDTTELLRVDPKTLTPAGVTRPPAPAAPAEPGKQEASMEETNVENTAVEPDLKMKAQQVCRHPEAYAPKMVEWARLYEQYLANPADAAVNLRLATYYLERFGHWRLALPHLKNFYDRSRDAAAPEDPRYVCYLGLSALSAGDYGKAESRFQQLIRREPHPFGAHFFLGICKILQGRHEEATQHLEKVVRMKPDWVTPYSLLVSLYLQDSQVESARRLLESRLTGEAGEFLAPLWDLFLQDPNGMPRRAAQYLEGLLYRYVKGSPSLLGEVRPELAAGAELSAGTAGAARGKAAEAVDLQRGMACLRSDDPQEAERRLRAALQAQPDNAQAHFYLGCSQLLQAKDAEAMEHFADTIELSPGWPDPCVVLAALYWAKGDAQAAERIIARGLSHQPPAPVLLRLVEDVKQGGPSAALSHLKDVLTAHLSQNPPPSAEAQRTTIGAGF